jgi:uncharacterized protein YecT (DUF1311 family)
VKYLVILFIITSWTNQGFSQPRTVSNADSLNIERHVEASIEALWASRSYGFRLTATDSLYLRFASDTLRVNTRHRMYMDIDYSASGMIHYTYTALDEYDELLNIYYQLLMQALPENDRELLRQAQRRWIAYRDSEFALRTHMQQFNDSGSMHALIHAGNNLHFIKSRAIELYQYLYTLTTFQEFMRCFEEDGLCG